jgi:arginyl-tRNA--protein-N-Asp/Glu arginylyltransferase
LGQQLAIGMYSFADMDLQLFSLNFWITGCVIMAYLVEYHPITKILLTLREITITITKKFQLPNWRSEKSRNITKSN